MSRIAVVTDSNSGITQQEAKEYGMYVMPMPFYIDGEMFYEEIDFTQEEFYERLTTGCDIKTSMALVGNIIEQWDKILETYDEIVHIPMSSSLSSSCETAMMLAQDYDGRVQVVDNQRISVTQKRTVLDALELVEKGKSAAEIKQILETEKAQSSIYIMLDTLYYLKQGGRITPAAAALGTFLKLKPVLQIQGGKLDAFAKARTAKMGKNIMINTMKRDFAERFGDPEGANMHLFLAYSGEKSDADVFLAEVQEAFPNHTILMDPLALSVACHIGPGALAIACSKKIDENY